MWVAVLPFRVCAVIGVAAVGLGAPGMATGQPLPLAPPDTFVRDAAVSEDAQAAVQKDLSESLLDGLRRRDWQQVGEALTTDFHGRFPEPEHGVEVDDPLLDIRIYSGPERSGGDRGAFVETLRSHTDHWVSVERASWHTFEFLLDPARDRAYLRTHVQLGGPVPSGGRVVLEGTAAAEVVRRDDVWRVRRFELETGHGARSPRAAFREITDAVGLHINRSASNEQLRQEIADTGMSLIDSALGVVDWNDDGFWDILVTEAATHGLVFVNDGRGGFVREPLPYTTDTLIPSQALYVDLDGDGREELVGSRVTYRGEKAWMAIYTRPEGVWIAKPRALTFDNPPGLRRNETQLITAADVNGDGRTDLFIGGYQNNRSGQPRRFNRVDATDGDDNLLFINQGELRFTEESDIRGVTGTRYTYVSEFFDFDGDGDLDLFEGNDFGPNAVWMNAGDGRFQADTTHPLAQHSANTMGLTIGDWDNAGVWSVYLSNMYSHAGNRVVRLIDRLSDTTQSQLTTLARGNQLFEMDARSGSWTERAVELGVNEAGWAWASVFLDVDNDGDKEIFVTNGNASHQDRTAPDF